MFNKNHTNLVLLENNATIRLSYLYLVESANHDILKVNSYKYLGIWLDEHLTFDKSTKELTLAIETGRYAKPPVPVENRLCFACNKNCVENENHFLLDCPLYDDLRLI